ncbi:putative bifunctional diguanylate cyclase/phosphodiesterase [Glutamicibacter sp.]|uniref:putative bifunctional diguanylate cyclase/phosphodiesterase n=1 Tax=Glutamicibacter sp. TaxID=1931995 RepID=UPI002B475B88|nr:bifunctional diguanylate cyclase/phosphodiesterase [Glutamicibacter sp.]HJX78342.1 bifunctional diguanylate cyclase/phosphodiesterase [Glutamicibacter sp.]
MSDNSDPRIEDIVEAIVSISSGDFSVSLSPGPLRDDVDAITVGIKAMAVRLGATYDALEQRVAQRTVMLEKARGSLEVMAYTDALTGLANRAALIRALNAHRESLQRGEPAAVLFLLDLDSFKHINDTHGHNAGDTVLQEVARRLEANIRPGDFVARLGGDEFAILAHADLVTAQAMGQRLSTVLQEPMDLGTSVIAPGGSIGFCSSNPALNSEQWIEQADTAMYVAKRHATQKVMQFEQYMLYERHQKASLSAALRDALTSKEIFPVYQPIVCAATGVHVGVEALARWAHPQLGVLPPIEFLPLAAAAGISDKLTARILSATLSDLSSWRAQGAVPEDFRVQVNVTPAELSDLSFPDIVQSQLRRYQIPAACLVIEVTEERYISDGKLELYTLNGLRNMGVKVYIDDFGAGYSSFGYLSKLPVAGVKIDRSLNTEVETSARQRAILRSIFDLAVACELDCIVEGVETASQEEALKRLGATYFQGYFYGLPGAYTPTMGR